MGIMGKRLVSDFSFEVSIVLPGDVMSPEYSANNGQEPDREAAR
jgi:hypothetical protein